MPSAGPSHAPTPVCAVEDATALIAAALSDACNGSDVATATWCLVLLDPDGGAPLHEQRLEHAAPLSAKRPLERACTSP